MKNRRGELIKVSDLFAKYKDKIRPPQQTVVEAACEVIYDVTGITLDSKKCRYTVHTRTLATNAPAIIKQEIAKKQAKIIAHLKGRLGEHNAPKTIL